MIYLKDGTILKSMCIMKIKTLYKANSFSKPIYMRKFEVFNKTRNFPCISKITDDSLKRNLYFTSCKKMAGNFNTIIKDKLVPKNRKLIAKDKLRIIGKNLCTKNSTQNLKEKLNNMLRSKNDPNNGSSISDTTLFCNIRLRQQYQILKSKVH